MLILGSIGDRKLGKENAVFVESDVQQDWAIRCEILLRSVAKPTDLEQAAALQAGLNENSRRTKLFLPPSHGSPPQFRSFTFPNKAVLAL